MLPSIRETALLKFEELIASKPFANKLSYKILVWLASGKVCRPFESLYVTPLELPIKKMPSNPFFIASSCQHEMKTSISGIAVGS